MIVTRETKYILVKNILSEADFETIKSKVTEEDLKAAKNLSGVTVGLFLSLVNGSEKEIKEFLFEGTSENEITVYDYAVRTRKLQDEIEKIFKLLNSYNIQTDKEREASAGIAFPTFTQSTLIYCMKEFGLKSFEEAGNVKLYEFMTMKKNQAAQIKFNNNYLQLK